MRMIDADALMGRLEKKRSETGNQRYTEGFNDALMRFRSMIHSASTIDAEPVRHGTWELINTPSMFMRMFECSICKGRVGTTVKTNYCPNCGAKMDGGGGDED